MAHLVAANVGGPVTGGCVPPDRRDAVVDCGSALAKRTALPGGPMLRPLGIAPAKYARWRASCGALATAHGPASRERHLTRAERDGILAFHERQPQHGYRQLTNTLFLHQRVTFTLNQDTGMSSATTMITSLTTFRIPTHRHTTRPMHA